MRFTGKERDSETGLDFFGARYFSSPQGRFTSPDAPFADQHTENPQSWNLYSYTLNNPLRFVDPNGTEVQSPQFNDQRFAFVYNLAAGGVKGLVRIATETYNTTAELLNAQGAVSNGPTVHFDTVPSPEYSNIDQKIGGDMAQGTVALYGARPVSEAGTVTRYMGEGEAAVAERTGQIPNTNAQGEFRPTHVTTDAPVNSGSQAQTKYELPATPTHSATVPASRVKDLQRAPDGRPTTSGGGSQAATHQPIPVKKDEIKRLWQ